MYLTLTRYDRGEEYSVWNVCKDYDEALQQFKEDLIDWFGYGPDDVSQIYFIECHFASEEDEQEFIEQVKSYNNPDSLTAEDMEFLDDLFNDLEEDDIIFQYTGTDVYDWAVNDRKFDSDYILELPDEEWHEFIVGFVEEQLDIE